MIKLQLIELKLIEHNESDESDESEEKNDI
jgi:hypothetical protein